MIETIQVPMLEKGVRLSDLSNSYFRSINSRKAFKNAVKKGLIYINDKRGFTADYIFGGEKIDVFEDQNKALPPTIDLAIEVLYEDDYLAVVIKPAGIEVSGNKRWTLEHALSHNLKPSDQPDSTVPEPIHRLDYPTSGLLLIGKTRSVIISLNKLFEERKVKKIYHAICIGEMEGGAMIESDIDDKESKSEYEVLKRVESPKYTYLNLVKLIPYTGRRHQLRKHLESIGNPIFGDLLYSKKGLELKGKGLYLHASSLGFTHPVSNENLIIECVLPSKFRKIFP
ncbi:MAG: RluA family pseudouridine synthase [Bacteroidales bacterium]|nr:RluA family pseudouridine synthase [Bacteroidales bacterium]